MFGSPLLPPQSPFAASSAQDQSKRVQTSWFSRWFIHRRPSQAKRASRTWVSTTSATLPQPRPLNVIAYSWIINRGRPPLDPGGGRTRSRVTVFCWVSSANPIHFSVEKVKVHCSRTEKTQKPRRLREDKLTILTKNPWCAARRYSLFFRERCLKYCSCRTLFYSNSEAWRTKLTT